MKSSDRAILIGLLIVGLLAAFWFMILAPKRSKLSDLDGQIATLQQSVSEQEQLATYAESSKDRYESNYRELVVLGKAVPSSGDTSSLFVQINELAERAGLSFNAITLSDSGGSAEPATPAAATTADPATPSGVGGATASGSTESTASTTATTPSVTTTPTEADAAALPIGATVGLAGLPVMPYTVRLTGNFFQLADFLASLDKMVGAKHGRQVVDGRLTTINGFSLAGDPEDGFPTLNATVAITTYVTPADQGVTAGATPTAPPTTVSSTPPTTPAP